MAGLTVSIRSLRAAAYMAGVIALAAGVMAEPVKVEPIKYELGGAPVAGYSAKIDLADPAVELLVTAPLPDAVTQNGQRVEAILTPTDVWAEREGVRLAINANYFGKLGKLTNPPKSEAEEAKGFWTAGEASDIVGLSMSAGRVVSAPRMHGGRGDPALVVRADRSASIGYLTESDLSGADEAIAGVGGGESDKDPGTLLVLDGVNLGATARVQPTVRHPRTAVGLSRDGRTLIVAVVDGRQPGHSVGLTLPELADLMIKLGADEAINLDGGGSSSFVYLPEGAEKVVNRPSDVGGRFRPVANHLGVRVREPAAKPGK